MFVYALTVAVELPIAELVENRRRSIAMLAPGVPALNREETLELLEQLVEALRQLDAKTRTRSGSLSTTTVGDDTDIDADGGRPWLAWAHLRHLCAA